MRTLTTDYLVVGAGAMGLAFVDSLITHADVHVTLVDRRFAAGGHWLDAYPFVQLHQASRFYGVSSRTLGTGALQRSGPEAGLPERARQAEIVAYFDDVLHRRLISSGQVSFLPCTDVQGTGSTRTLRSLISGERTEVNLRRRIVDARYLSPRIPATSPPPFGVADGVHVVPVNELPRLAETPNDFVVTGSGKTATDAIVWLIRQGVAAERIVWVRPRDPWMLNRARVQPHPASAAGLSADIMSAAAGSTDLDQFFLGLEDAGAMLRIDRASHPTMARCPTLGTWELDILRSIERVVRLGHIRHIDAREITLERGTVPLGPGSVVVHCAGEGLASPGLEPIWQPRRIRLQTIRAGFPCFCAALAGYVEATRDDDRERNRLCAPNAYGNSLRDWVAMQVRGMRASATYQAEPDIAAWMDTCALNPAQVLPEQRDDPALLAARQRMVHVSEAGMARLTELAELHAAE